MHIIFFISHVIFPYFGGTFLFLSKSPHLEFQNFLILSYISPYFEFQTSLFEIKKFLLCLIILPILKSKSSYLASQLYHMYVLYATYHFHFFFLFLFFGIFFLLFCSDTEDGCLHFFLGFVLFLFQIWWVSEGRGLGVGFELYLWHLKQKIRRWTHL